MKQEFIEKIMDSELILVGIGKEFEENKYNCSARAIAALKELQEILYGKNYFFITTCTNSILHEVGIDEERTVTPCGGIEKKQCPNNCENSLQNLEESEVLQIKADISSINCEVFGKCPICGTTMELNNIYASNYDENGYLDDWKRYTKWLQGTLNKKLCVLELGVDLGFPTIIRWPFEKVVFYNNKAVFIRVNEKLYHMTEELYDKGISISCNAIDWIMDKDV